MKIVTYTTILHEKREELGLTANEYVCVDVIDKLSNPWCYIGKEKLARLVGIPMRTLRTLESNLVGKDLLKKGEKGTVQSTQKWRDAVNMAGQGEETSDKMADDVAKMAGHYNKKDIDINKIKDFLPGEQKQDLVSNQKEETTLDKKTETPVKDKPLDKPKKQLPVKKPEVAHDPKTQLPLWSAKSPLARLICVYGAKYHDRYQTAYHAQFWGKYGMLYKPLLSTFTEYQISALILLHFDWKGATGTDDFTHKRLVDANFPLEWIPKSVNAYKTYIINVLGVEFDTPAEIKKYVVDQLKQLSEFKRKD